MHNQHSRAPLRVLFVDDDPEIRALYRRLVRRAGLDGDIAANGVEALGLARHRRYSVVVTDWSMPVVDGERLVDRLSRTLPNAVPIVVTGVQPPPRVTRPAGAAVEVLSKPWLDRQLLDAIRRAATI